MNQSQREFEFALVVTGIDELSDSVADKLFEAGCDDATFAMRGGKVYATFERAADSMKDAIFSAIRNIQAANVGAIVQRIDDCNLVTQADIARRAGRSRQYIGQLIAGSRGPGNFPAPACHIHEKHPLWLWCEVAHWLWRNNLLKENAVHEARQVAIINCLLDMRYQNSMEPNLVHEIEAEMHDLASSS